MVKHGLTMVKTRHISSAEARQMRIQAWFNHVLTIGLTISSMLETRAKQCFDNGHPWCCHGSTMENHYSTCPQQYHTKFMLQPWVEHGLATG